MPQGNGSGKHAGSDRDLTAALNPLWEQIRQIKGDLVDLKLIKEKGNPQPNKILQENGDLKQENENLKKENKALLDKLHAVNQELAKLKNDRRSIKEDLNTWQSVKPRMQQQVHQPQDKNIQRHAATPSSSSSGRPMLNSFFHPNRFDCLQTFQHPPFFHSTMVPSAPHAPMPSNNTRSIYGPSNNSLH